MMQCNIRGAQTDPGLLQICKKFWICSFGYSIKRKYLSLAYRNKSGPSGQCTNKILAALGAFGLLFWVFHYSHYQKYVKPINKDNYQKECEEFITNELNIRYNETYDKVERSRFGNSLFDITSLLRLRGIILAAGITALCCYVAASGFIVTTFTKGQKKNRSNAVRNFWFYTIFTCCGVIFTITLGTLFFWPIHSCIFNDHKIPIVFLIIVFTGPYKILEWCVTTQYLRILHSFTFTRAVMGRNITAEEPGWLVVWWKNRNQPKDYKERIAAEKENAKKLDQDFVVQDLKKVEDKYRKRNRARIKRTEAAFRITWQERIGKYRTDLPNPNRGSGSGCFSLESSGTWGSNITRSMSRSSPDSSLSVESYMDNYEDYYDILIKEHGGDPTEGFAPSSSKAGPPVFVFKNDNRNRRKSEPVNVILPAKKRKGEQLGMNKLNLAPITSSNTMQSTTLASDPSILSGTNTTMAPPGKVKTTPKELNWRQNTKKVDAIAISIPSSTTESRLSDVSTATTIKFGKGKTNKKKPKKVKDKNKLDTMALPVPSSTIPPSISESHISIVSEPTMSEIYTGKGKVKTKVLKTKNKLDTLIIDPSGTIPSTVPTSHLSTVSATTINEEQTVKEKINAEVKVRQGKNKTNIETGQPEMLEELQQKRAKIVRGKDLKLLKK